MKSERRIMGMGDFRVKRVYDEAENSDGVRVLVDRLWPRGLTKEKANIAVWMKEIAPSSELRSWFSHQPERFMEFESRYLEELALPTNHSHLEQLQMLGTKSVVTLLFGAKDVEHNNAVVLKCYLDDLNRA